MGEQNRQAVVLAELDQVFADLKQYQEDIAIIAEHGLPSADDEGAAEYHQNLIKMLACAVMMELNHRQM